MSKRKRMTRRRGQKEEEEEKDKKRKTKKKTKRGIRIWNIAAVNEPIPSFKPVIVDIADL